MRLAFDVRALQYPGKNRGIGRYTLEMAQALATLPGLKLFLLAEPNRPLPESLAGFPRLPASSYRPALRQLGCLWDELQAARWSRFPVDVIHLTSTFDLNFGWPTRCLIPQVITVHDMFAVQHPLPSWRRLAAPIYRWLAFKMSFARHLVCVSQATESAVRDCLGPRCPPTSFTHSGVRQLETPPHLDRPPGDYLLIFPCWPAHKNVSAVVSALRPLGSQAPPLVLAGSIPNGARDSLQQLAGQVPLRWVGEVSEPELLNLYSGCRGMLVPSLYEGFGLTILEAQRCGVPVAVSNRGPMNELVPDQSQTFDPLDPEAIRQACARLWEPVDLFEQRKKALGFSRQFSWPATAQQVAQTYLTCKSPPAGGRL